jgi:hypothetical protein
MQEIPAKYSIFIGGTTLILVRSRDSQERTDADSYLFSGSWAYQSSLLLRDRRALCTSEI